MNAPKKGYKYHPHGPLQRVELGEHKVQGLDYAYTLQGWLKGINSDVLIPKTDMGHDGLAGTANALVGRDAFGESIGYFGDEDYKAIDATRWGGSFERPFAAVGTTGTLALGHNPLYNGNIAHTVNSLQPWGGWTSPVQPAQVLAQVYKYDQLNRLKQAQGVEGLTVAANTWDGVTDGLAKRYRSDYTYDANGNIQTAQRYGNEDVDANGEADQYDDLRYSYEKSSGNLLRNRLYHLNETKYGGYGDIGIDISGYHNAHEDVNLLNNYKYDELGNLIADKREQIANIEWTVSGKVKHITRTAGSTKPELWFTYGADGQRISKTVGDPLNGGFREWYVRDAQGNIMAMYRHTNTGPKSLKVTDRPVYGSSRIGSYTRQIELVGESLIINYPYTQPMQAPLKRYELTDHLGNVNTVVTGRLLPGNGAGSAKQAEVVSAQGYESFGAHLPNRSFQGSNYLWGFGGQMKDDEIYGAEGTSYTAEFWQYDPRVGRRWNLDPVVKAWESPYAVMGNNPIVRVDPNGDEFVNVHTKKREAAQEKRNSAQKSLESAQSSLDKYSGMFKKEIKESGMMSAYKQDRSTLKDAQKLFGAADKYYQQQVLYEGIVNSVLENVRTVNSDLYNEFNNWDPRGTGIIDIFVSAQNEPVMILDTQGFPTGQTTTEGIKSTQTLGGAIVGSPSVRLKVTRQDDVIKVRAMASLLVHALGHVDKGYDRDEHYAVQFQVEQYDNRVKKSK